MPAAWARTKPLARWVANRPLGPLGRKQVAGAAIFLFSSIFILFTTKYYFNKYMFWLP
jgi:hypothetical protein